MNHVHFENKVNQKYKKKICQYAHYHVNLIDHVNCANQTFDLKLYNQFDIKNINNVNLVNQVNPKSKSNENSKY